MTMTSTRTIIVALAIAVAAIPTKARAQAISGRSLIPPGRRPPRRRRPPRPSSLTLRRRTRSHSATSPGCPATRAPRSRRSTRKVFTGEFRADTNFTYSFNKPIDDTIGGSSEIFRSGRVPGHAARHRRRLPLRQRPGPPDDPVRHVLADDAAQRREPGARAVAARHGVPLHLRGVRRLSLRQDERHQRPGRHLHVVRRAVELLQLRQLDLPAVVRVVEHAMVLQRHAHPDLPERQAEDRAVDHQRLAVVRQVQPRARPRRADPVPAERRRSRSCSTTTGARTRSAIRIASASTPTTASR